jgi:hypothetical protein
MAERYFPFDAGAGAIVVEDDWYKMARGYMLDGIIYQLATEITSPYVGPGTSGLRVTAVTLMDVSVNVGLASVRGGCYENTAAKTLTATTAPAGGNSRHDIVVLRLDRSANTITALIQAGTPAATGSQVDPTLNKGPVTWDVPLARLLITGGSGTVGTITDLRTWAYLPGPVGCTLRRVANQSIPTGGSTTTLLWDTEDWDPYGFITVTSGTLTIPMGLGGEYAIAVRTSGGTGLGTRNLLDITVTAAATGVSGTFRASPDAAGTATFGSNGIPTIDLAAGDTLSVGVYHNVGSASNYTGWLNLRRKGEPR